jgi:hypothetical protein
MHITRTDSLVGPDVDEVGVTDDTDSGAPAASWVRRHTDRAIVLAALLIATIGFLASEKIGLNDGLGWDGAIYAGWVGDFPGALREGIDAYRIQRVFPAALAHYVLHIFESEISTRHVIRAFGALNILCTVLVALLWCRIARELEISDAGKWLGFAGLIFSFAMTKYASFNPVLTDTTAMAISTAMCYCYLRRWQFRMLAVITLGAFTWPTLIYIGAVLVLFPRRPELDVQVGPAPRNANLALAGLVTFYVGLWTIYVLRDIKGPVFGFLGPIEAVVPLSVCVLLVYLYFGLQELLNNARLFQPAQYFTPGNGLAVLALVVVIVGIKAVQAEASVRPGYMGLKTYLLLIGIEPVAKPGVSIVAAVAFFGPLVIVAMFVWKPVCTLIHRHGLGLTLAVIIGLIHTIDSESRHFNYLIPLVVPMVVKAIEPMGWRRGQYGFIVSLAALSTKAWLSIKGNFNDNVFLYPDQLYSMHLGPFMSTEMYVVHLAAVTMAALAIYLVCFQERAGRMLGDGTGSVSVIRMQPPRKHVRTDSNDKAWSAAS